LFRVTMIYTVKLQYYKNSIIAMAVGKVVTNTTSLQ